MLYDAICELIEGLIIDFLLWIGDMTSFLIETSLKIESAHWISDNPISKELIEDIYLYIYGAIVILVTLRFLWKGFQVYILWRDGDADTSPHALIVGACYALIACIAFPFLFQVGVSATSDIGDGIMEVIDSRWVDKPEDISKTDMSATEIWEYCFSEYDTNGDYYIDDTEWEDLSNAILDADSSQWDALSSRILFAFPENVLDLNMVAGSFDLITYYKIENISGIETVLRLCEEEKISLKLDTSGLVSSLGALLLLLIYLILYIVMYVKLIGRGVEMLFLRWGFPIASIGLINSDGGVFPSYVQLILRQYATTLLQVVALYLSFFVAMYLTVPHTLMALAIIGVAFRGPALMAQILAPQKQSGGMGQKLHTALMLRQMWRR